MKSFNLLKQNMKNFKQKLTKKNVSNKDINIIFYLLQNLKIIQETMELVYILINRDFNLKTLLV